MELIQAQIQCPYCWQVLDILVDPSCTQQEYIEDCQVCCHPILISLTVNDGIICELNVEQENK